MGYVDGCSTQLGALDRHRARPKNWRGRNQPRVAWAGLSGITGGTFAGELRYKAPTAARRASYLTTERREQCVGLRTLGSATPEQLARLEPGGDLYAEFGSGGWAVLNGAICQNGTEFREQRVTKYQDIPATPGAWFLHHERGGISRIVNPLAEWGTPDVDTSRGPISITGRKDDRTLPWNLQVDASTETGSLYADPDAPPSQTDTEVTALDPQGERVRELRAAQAAEQARLQEELAARRAAEAEGAGAESDGTNLIPGESGGAAGPGLAALAARIPLLPLAIAAGLLLLRRR